MTVYKYDSTPRAYKKNNERATVKRITDQRGDRYLYRCSLLPVLFLVMEQCSHCITHSANCLSLGYSYMHFFQYSDRPLVAHSSIRLQSGVHSRVGSAAEAISTGRPFRPFLPQKRITTAPCRIEGPKDCPRSPC